MVLEGAGLATMAPPGVESCQRIVGKDVPEEVLVVRIARAGN